MQIHPSNWDLLLYQPHITQYRFTINGSVMSPDFIQGVPTIEKPMMLEPVIGRCCTGSLTIDVRQGDVDRIPKAASVNVDCRLSSYDKTIASDWIPQGRYFVTKRSGYGDLVTLTCRDSMIYAGKTYLDKAGIHTWPATMAAVLADIARVMNVSIDDRTDIQTGTEYMINTPEDDTLMSEVLAQIAAVHGGNFIVTESGKLRLVPFPFTSDPVYDLKQEYKTYTPYSSGDNTVSRIILKNAEGQQFTVGNDTGVWITGECDTATQAMTNRLSGGAYSFANGTMYFPSGAFVAGTAVITDEALDFDTAGTAKTAVAGLLGRTYTPYRLDGAYIDPCIELGDTFTALYKGKLVQLIANTITVNCTTGYTCRIENGIMYDDEEEVVYTTPKEREQERTAARAVRNTSRIAREEQRAQEEEASIKATLSVLDDKIDARVTKQDVDSTLENYLLIDQFASELGSVLKTPDQTIRASIVTAINEQKGEGIVNINGDRVYVDANKSVSIGSVLDIYNGSLWGKVQAVFGTPGNLVTINNGAVKAPTIQVNGGGSLIFSGSSSPDSPVPTVSIDRADAEKLKALTSFTGLTNAEIINGKTLKITKANGDTINFSKATAVYYSGTVSADGQSKQAGWRSGTFTVIATQTNRNTSTGQDETNEVGRASTTLKSIVLNGTPTQGQTQKKYMNASLKVLYDNGDPESDGTDTGMTPQTVGIDAAPVYNYGWGEARNDVKWPTAGTTNAYMDVEVPSATVDGTPEKKRFYVKSTQNDAYISIAGANETWTNYAHVQHNQYNLGRGSVNVTVGPNGDVTYTPPTGEQGTHSVQNCGTYHVPIKATGDNGDSDSTTISFDPEAAWSDGYATGVSSGSSSGYTDGQNNTLVVKGSWVTSGANAGKITFSTNAPNPVSGSSKTLQILSTTQIGTLNSGGTAIGFTVYEHVGTDNDVDTGARISATIANKTLSVSGTHSENGVYTLSGIGSVSVGGATINLTGSGTLTATEAINYGKSQVGLNHTFDWNSSGTHANTYTVKTSGRTNANGVTNEDVDYLVPTAAINLGKSQVDLNHTFDWNSSGTHANTYTIKTSGRTTTAGVTNEDVDYLTPTAAINLGKSQVGLNHTFNWNSSGTHANTYTIRTSGRTTTAGVTNEDVDYLVPTEAYQAGQNSVSASLDVFTGTPSSTPRELTSDRNYVLKLTKGSTDTAVEYVHVPAGGGGGGNRTVRELYPSTIVLDTTDTTTSDHTLNAYYTSGIDTTPVSISIDASNVFSAGVAQGMGGNIDVVSDGWSTNSSTQVATRTFRPSAGNGAVQTVTLSQEPVGGSSSSGSVRFKDGGTTISTAYLTLGRVGDKVVLKHKTSEGQTLEDLIHGVISGTTIAQLTVGSGGEIIQTDVDHLVKAGEIEYSSNYKSASIPVSAQDSQNRDLLTSNISFSTEGAWEAGRTVGRSEGSNLQIQAIKDATSNPLTANTDYTLYPDTPNQVMGAIKVRVNVPQGIQSSSYIETDTDNISEYDNSASISKKYCRVTINPIGSDPYYFKIDASDVYQRGVTAGSGYTVKANESKTVYDPGSYTITPTASGSVTYNAMEKVTLYVSTPRIQDSVSETVYPGTTTVQPTGQFGAMKKAIITVPTVDMVTTRDQSVPSGATTMNLTPGHNIRFQLKYGSTVYKTIYVLGKTS